MPAFLKREFSLGDGAKNSKQRARGFTINFRKGRGGEREKEHPQKTTPYSHTAAQGNLSFTAFRAEEILLMNCTTIKTGIVENTRLPLNSRTKI